ncbi:MAG: UDP-N-acetylmuramoyl-tripeptide--D-alanyl-D-alanine ligase [Rickettsiales bacterium]|jgi:UDP-N-acetylmuramoyl-tripeptide--D-alanyl-D-alanine ligase|nr:UDP-N-acetylmuramoyl-tripeptide--D-alanyl-D-alanine ligase [Rickettsiales bacterium]
MLFNRDDLKKALKGEIVFIDDSREITIECVVFDSREIKDNALFAARKGSINDGHDFIISVLGTNASAVVLGERVPNGLENDGRIILVKNINKALENLARFSRNRIRGTTIGITGSVGKTSTKDIVFSVLSRYGKRVYCNQYSFNNYTGVLITLLNAPPQSEYLLCEMGIGGIGEMATLVDLVKPEIVIVTNVKSSHISYMGSEKNVAVEKSQIISTKTRLAILNMDDSWYKFMRTRALENKNEIITFGTSAEADICLEQHDLAGEESVTFYRVGGQSYFYSSKNLDYSTAYNAMAAIALVRYMGFALDIALESLSSYVTTRGRNNIEYASYVGKGETINITLINGSYNAVIPDTFISGLKLMNNIFAQGKTIRKVCLWGDMLETGNMADEFHLSLREWVIGAEISLLITIGENMKKLSISLEGGEVQLAHFDSVGEIILNIKNILKNGDLVFIKSSKGMKTYEVLNYLLEDRTGAFQ